MRLAVMMLVSAAGLAACSSGSDSDSTPTLGEDVESGTLLSDETTDVPEALPNAARRYVLDYAMDSVSGDVTFATAQLFEPTTRAPDDGHPLVVWAHGTTGIANVCTPSRSFSDFGNAVAIDALLSAGYAVLAPDYEGFGTSVIHPYYVRSSHAEAVLAAVPAAHRVTGTHLSDDWAVVGHSQGGHVALAAARAEQHAAYPLQAVAALAPGTDLRPFTERAFEAIDAATANGDLAEAAERTYYLSVYGAFVAHAFALVEPAFNPQSLFGEDVADLLDGAISESNCGDYADSVADALNQHVGSGGTLAEFGGLKRQWYENALIAGRIDAQALADEVQAAPLLIVQGDADRQVPVAATTAFADQQRSVGTDVTYELISGGRHGDVARAEFGRTLAWLAERFPPR